MANATYRQIPALVEARTPFTGNSMVANAYPTGAHCSTGRLTGVNLDEFNNYRGQIRYVVFSYWTPIAWTYADGSTYRVSQKFSVTTSKHQGMLRGF